MPVLKKLGVLSVAKLQAVVMAIFGLIYGIFLAALGSMAALVAPGLGGFMAGFGLLSIVIFPIL